MSAPKQVAGSGVRFQEAGTRDNATCGSWPSKAQPEFRLVARVRIQTARAKSLQSSRSKTCCSQRSDPARRRPRWAQELQKETENAIAGRSPKTPEVRERRRGRVEGSKWCCFLPMLHSPRFRRAPVRRPQKPVLLLRARLRKSDS